MTSELQRLAASPDRSVFVSANAGTGKTKVLIERVLRLLLQGEVPDTILCVTFTNAAAAEIEARLQKKLASWAVIPREALTSEILAMTGEVPSQKMIDVARRLFAKVIDNDQGPRIETTHSFSQSLLSRFPIEAGLAPHFELISEGQQQALLQRAFASAFAEPSAEIKGALALLIAKSDHQTILDHIKSFVSHRQLSDAAIAMPMGMTPGFAKSMKALCPDDADEAQIARRISADIKALPWGSLIEALPAKMRLLAECAALGEEELAAMMPALSQEYLTTKYEAYARFVPKKLAEADPSLIEQYQRLADKLIAYVQAVSAYQTRQLSSALYVVGRHVATYYQRAKLQAAVVDYDDLILKADRLLASSEARAWVRWKLDFGIHHLLVDEAQDTNPAQWDLLASLADEFFAHEEEADSETKRTVFSVGDFKQSIYSFQGANPDVFIEKGSSFAQQAAQAGHLFEDVKLSKSFRSSSAVLHMVNQVMTGDGITGLGGSYQDHDAFFKDKFGLVELWPIETAGEAPADLPYFDVPDFVDDGTDQAHGADAALANKIARHINTLLDGSATGLDGRRYQPGDIMILVNRRNAIYALIRGALLRHNIPVAGADRLLLTKQIEIEDLLALGDVCLLPEDDLQLASVLKSPLIGLDEEALFTLAAKRPKGQSLIAALKTQAGTDSALGKAAAKLEYYFDLASALTPASFFETVLSRGGREAFYARLGTGIDEALNAFITLAYEFEQQGGVSLTDFIQSQRANETEVKRDFGDEGANEVRIMTIHGSKGLEAPVVYVPDIVKGVEPTDSLVQTQDALFWPANSSILPDLISAPKQADKAARAAEHQRLLYVAMTRASECLFLAGYEKARKTGEGTSWDELLAQGFAAAGITEDEDGIRRFIHHGAPTQAHPQDDKPINDKTLSAQREGDITKRLAWAFTAPAAEPVPIRPLMPSMAQAAEVPQSVQDDKSQTARLEGLFQHHLLELVGEAEPALRQEISARLIAMPPRPFNAIKQDRRQMLGDKMLAFMAMPAYAPLFSEGALAEFGISGMVGTRAVVGQIDKLVVQEQALWLVDFKSGRPQTKNVPQDYILQMALYAHLLADIYPDKDIRAEIIWLQDFTSSEITLAQRDEALRAANLC